MGAILAAVLSIVVVILGAIAASGTDKLSDKKEALLDKEKEGLKSAYNSSIGVVVVGVILAIMSIAAAFWGKSGASLAYGGYNF